jgi:hypothetical protein
MVAAQSKGGKTLRPRLALLITFAAITVLGAACGSGGNDQRDRMGIPEVDRVIDAVLSSDVDTLVSLLKYHQEPCASNPAGIPSPPPCEEGQPEGTPVEVIMGAACEGYYVTRESAPEWLGQRAMGEDNLELFAVYRTESFLGWDADYVILFRALDVPAAVDGEQWRIADGGVVGVGGTCSSAAYEARSLEKHGATAVLPPAPP